MNKLEIFIIRDRITKEPLYAPSGKFAWSSYGNASRAFPKTREWWYIAKGVPNTITDKKTYFLTKIAEIVKVA